MHYLTFYNKKTIFPCHKKIKLSCMSHHMTLNGCTERFSIINKQHNQITYFFYLIIKVLFQEFDLFNEAFFIHYNILTVVSP